MSPSSIKQTVTCLRCRHLVIAHNAFYCMEVMCPCKAGEYPPVTCLHEWVTAVEGCLGGENEFTDLRNHYHPKYDISDNRHDDEEGIDQDHIFCHKCKVILSRYQQP